MGTKTIGSIAAAIELATTSQIVDELFHSRLVRDGSSSLVDRRSAQLGPAYAPGIVPPPVCFPSRRPGNRMVPLRFVGLYRVPLDAFP